MTLCGDPEQPVSSQVNRSESAVSYSCAKGFRLEGEAVRRCDTATGAWSGAPPRCIGGCFESELFP